jgi:hypothetical protein
MRGRFSDLSPGALDLLLLPEMATPFLQQWQAGFTPEN